MSDLLPHTRDDLVELPCDCELPAPPGFPHPAWRETTEAPAVAERGALLYTINSNRSRYQIIADYAAAQDLSVKHVDELVRQLPDYGVRSVISLADERARRKA